MLSPLMTRPFVFANCPYVNGQLYQRPDTLRDALVDFLPRIAQITRIRKKEKSVEIRLIRGKKKKK